MKAEAEAKSRIEAEAAAAKSKAEAEARHQNALQQADDEAARQTEERQKQEAAVARQKAESEASARAKAESEKRASESTEAGLRLGTSDRQRIQIALTSLGFDTRGSDGVFGPRSREMIAAWQRSRNLQPTGYLNSAQQQALMREAEQAVARYDNEQRRAEAERTADQKRRSAEEDDKAKAFQPPPNSTAALPSAVVPPTEIRQGHDGPWSGALACSNGDRQIVQGTVANNGGRLVGGTVSLALNIRNTTATVKVDNQSPYGNVGSLTGEVRGQSISARGWLRRPGSPATFDCNVNLTRQ